MQLPQQPLFLFSSLLNTFFLFWITSALYLISGGFIIFPYSKLDKLSVAVAGCWWTRGLVLMSGIIGIIKNNESFYLHPLCFCSCLCPSSLDVVQWPRRCWVKGLSGSPWPSTLVSLWESWWPSTWPGECQVKSVWTRTWTQLTVITTRNHPLCQHLQLMIISINNYSADYFLDFTMIQIDKRTYSYN